MKRKRWIAVLLAVVMCVAVLTACSSGKQGGFEGPSLGTFIGQDINGNEYTQDMFKGYDLTLVNLFTTWCNPCVAEMPELEKLYQQWKDEGVNVVGFVLDVLDEDGKIVQENLGVAQELVKQTGVTYPVLIPDATSLNGRLNGISSFPETFFVDGEGNVVGKAYVGSNNLEGWQEVVEKELAALKK